MLDVLLTASISFIITFLAIPVVLQIAEQKRLFDPPDERKIHSHVIASLGGVGIFGGFLMASLLSIRGYLNPEFQFFFAAALVIFFLGLKDDLNALSATKKIIGQLIAASVLVHLGDIKITSMHGFMGVYDLPEAFSLAITYFTIIVVINSFNLIDGIDGLASCLGICTMLIFGTYFLMTGFQAYALLSYSLAGSLVAFLIFNHHPARIFMGDSGSLLIGLVNAILVIKFINVASDKALPNAFLDSSVAIAFSILFIPLLDTLRVFSVRIFSGKSPFTPDRNHIHHILLDWGFGHASVTLICVSANLFFVAAAYYLRFLGSTIALSILLAIAFSAIAVLYYKRPKAIKVQLRPKTTNGNPSKLVALKSSSAKAESQ